MNGADQSTSKRKFAMLRAWNYFLVASNISFAIVLAVIVYRSNWLAPAPNPQRPLELVLSLLDRQQQTGGPPSPIEYKDFVAILLSALSVMIAILGLLLAAAAIWGYQELKGAALKAALEQVEKTVPSIAARAAEAVARQQVAGDRSAPNLNYTEDFGEAYGAAAGEGGGTQS